jgi:hypothetical protein
VLPPYLIYFLGLYLQVAELVYTHGALPTPQWHVYPTHDLLEIVSVMLFALSLRESTAKTTTITMFKITVFFFFFFFLFGGVGLNPH